MSMPRGRSFDQERAVTTTISLPESEYIALKHLAIERRTTVRELVREALGELLAKSRKTKSRKKGRANER
jgi:hypothetical protein